MSRIIILNKLYFGIFYEGHMKLSKLFGHFVIFIALIWVLIFFDSVNKYKTADYYPEYVYKNLYVDSSFTDEEVNKVIEATIAWSETTSSRVNYKVIPINKNSTIIDVKDGILINKVNIDFIDVIALDYLNKNSTLGYYTSDGIMPHIGVVIERVNSTQFKTVIMHEIGHSLGLLHNEGDEGIGTLMYPYIELQSDYITDKDLSMYCSLHHCKSKN